MSLPALYIGHGAPMLLDDDLWTSQLSTVAAGILGARVEAAEAGFAG